MQDNRKSREVVDDITTAEKDVDARRDWRAGVSVHSADDAMREVRKWSFGTRKK